MMRFLCLLTFALIVGMAAGHLAPARAIDESSSRPQTALVEVPSDPLDDVWQERPFRLPDIDPESFTPEQKFINNEVNHYLGLKQISGPFRVWARDPSLLAGVLELLKRTNESKVLGARLTHLEAMTIARHWQAQFEWFIQAALAKQDGISPEVIRAIRLGNQPKFSRADENLIFDAITELDQTKSLSDRTFQRLYAEFGYDGVAEFVNFAGIFTMVGMTIKALRIEVPAPFPAHPIP